MSTEAADNPSPTGSDPGQRTVSITRGSIYLAREIYDAYFPAIQSVALIVRDDMPLIVPLIQESAGGLILKQRNARGDRVIQAQEFFRDKGYAEDFQEQTIAVHWNSEWAALALTGLRKINSSVVQT